MSSLETRVLDLNCSPGHSNSRVCVCVEETENFTIQSLTHFYASVSNLTEVDTLISMIRTLQYKLLVVVTLNAVRCRFVARFLSDFGIQTTIIHEEMETTKREDMAYQFNEGSLRKVLVCSTMSHIFELDNVSVVINFDMPRMVWLYRHRVCTQKERKGLVISFFNHPMDIKPIRGARKRYNIKIEEMPDPFDLDQNEYMDSS